MGLISFLIGMAATFTILHLTGLQTPRGLGIDTLRDAIRRVRVWHVAILAALMTLALACFDPGMVGSGIPQLMMMLIIAALFTWAWTREFSFLMSLRDEDLPGRFDKPIWVAILFFLAPVGLFLFRSYRLTHWPEAKPKPTVDVAHELA